MNEARCMIRHLEERLVLAKQCQQRDGSLGAALFWARKVEQLENRIVLWRNRERAALAAAVRQMDEMQKISKENGGNWLHEQLEDWNE